MDWNLFWSAFVAIGTTIGSITTAIAVVVAVVQYKQPLSKRIKITVNTSIPISDCGLDENYLCISIANTGVRTVFITNIYLNTRNKNIVINKLMMDLQNPYSEVAFPKELTPESVVQVYIPYSKLSDYFSHLANQNIISKNQKIKILATDTTLGEHYFKTKLKAKDIMDLN